MLLLLLLLVVVVVVVSNAVVIVVVIVVLNRISGAGAKKISEIWLHQLILTRFLNVKAKYVSFR